MSRDLAKLIQSKRSEKGEEVGDLPLVPPVAPDSSRAPAPKTDADLMDQLEVVLLEILNRECDKELIDGFSEALAASSSSSSKSVQMCARMHPDVRKHITRRLQKDRITFIRFVIESFLARYGFPDDPTLKARFLFELRGVEGLIDRLDEKLAP